jgi:hypothetical protein
MRGKIHLFSIDNLVVLLAAAGLRVACNWSDTEIHALRAGGGSRIQ